MKVFAWSFAHNDPPLRQAQGSQHIFYSTLPFIQRMQGFWFVALLFTDTTLRKAPFCAVLYCTLTLPHLPGNTGLRLHCGTVQPQVVPTLANTSGSLPAFRKTNQQPAVSFCFNVPKLYSVFRKFIFAPFFVFCA